MTYAAIAALLLLAAPAMAQAPGLKPAVCQWRAPGGAQGTGSLTTQVDTPCIVTGNAGTRTIVVQPRNGRAVFSANGGDLRYTPRRGFVGADEFVYAVAAPQSASGRRLFTVHVTVQREPVAAAPPPQSGVPPGWPACRHSGWEVGGTNAAVEYGSATMQVRAGNRCWMRMNFQGITLQIDQPPSRGQLVIDGGHVGYTSETGYSGGDSFTVRWSNGGQVRRLVVRVEVR